MDETTSVEVVLNEQRFDQLIKSLEAGKARKGVCDMHTVMTDCQILMLESNKVVLRNLHALQVGQAGMRREIADEMARHNAVAGAEIELEQKVNLNTFARVVKGAGPWPWICVTICALCYTLLKFKDALTA